MKPIERIMIEEIHSARERTKGSIMRTPLVRLNVNDTPGDIYLKLENLQPIGSFKIRGAMSVMSAAAPESLRNGVYTASAGNMAQGVAFAAGRRGVECHVIVPDTAPKTKLAAIERLGGRIIKVPYDTWWQVMVQHSYAGMAGTFIHPFADRRVIAGNGVIGLEILDDLPDVDSVIIPYGGGGLCVGIASAITSLKPDTSLYACEVESAAPLSASFAAGAPTAIAHTPSFVDGIGGRSVFPEMWPMVRALLEDSLVVSLDQTAAAIRLLIERNRVVAEGAGAVSVAAALTGRAGSGKIVCVISGGNIDSSKLVKILNGELP